MAFLNSLITLILGILIIGTKDGTWWGVLAVLMILSGILGMVEAENFGR